MSVYTADPRLSRFDPLERVFFYDDFDEGIRGWSELIGNYEHSLDSMLPEYKDMRPPMLSNLTMWDTGTAGSMEGSYALKLATRARAGSLATSIKRQTFRKRGQIQLECYFTFKPEASELRLSLDDVRAFGVLFDLQDGMNPEYRWMPHLRYLNAVDDEMINRWQVKGQTRPFHNIGDSGETVSHFHLGPENWDFVDCPAQTLCYNEIATKMNWHYLKVKVDLAERRFIGFQCNDLTYTGEALQHISIPAMPNLNCMLNTAFWVETNRDKRAFLYLDSVLLSGVF
ncbi:MAG: hypothetical protein OXI40_08245 [Chloroflexota bacterium]|nr:hypothetical protein [Chloroflexota bacterium]